MQKIQPGDHLSMIDLQDGFFHIGVRPEFQTFLGFKWKNQYFVWCCLPFGLGLSPYFFNKCLKPVVDFLADNGLRLALWVDDFLHMVEP